MKTPLSTLDLHGSLDYGLRMLEQVEARIREFPVILEEVDEEVSRIVHLSELLKSRHSLLNEWENKYGEEIMYNSQRSESDAWTLKGNLTMLGRRILDITIAIDTNLERLETEL